MYNDAIINSQKSKIALIFSEVDKRLVDGSDEHLAILDLALRISSVIGVVWRMYSTPLASYVVSFEHTRA